MDLDSEQTAELHTLYIFTHGKGSLHINNEQYHLSADKYYMLSPGAALQIKNEANTPLRFYQITFAVIRVGNPRHETYPENIFPGRYEFAVYPFTRFIRLIEGLY
ncbi:AraC family ligand binding domain-containing protein [Paenibacillus sp. OSY-SE]|uniref:AraC family ligand binding domain-containing protein n=1 Tax=Paenibacillus sp. OSY-SE TaxID=1196323 RepID=UPI000A2F131D